MEYSFHKRIIGIYIVLFVASINFYRRERLKVRIGRRVIHFACIVVFIVATGVSQHSSDLKVGWTK